MTPETLFVLAGIAPKILAVPDQGMPLAAWSGLSISNDKNEENTKVKPLKQSSYQSLYSKIWTMGARSENFCGTYGAEDFLQRIFWNNSKRVPFWK
jgi:hypothetical protein